MYKAKLNNTLLNHINLFVALTHVLEHISTAADVVQQVAIGYGHMMVWIVTFPERQHERRNSFMIAETQVYTKCTLVLVSRV